MAESFFRRIMAWHWGSPSDGQLLALQDGELSGKRRASVQAHLEQCSQCRERAARIAQDLNAIAALSSAAAAKSPTGEQELIADVQASIRAWSEANLPPTPDQAKQALSPTEAERQAVAILGLYIGQRAAKALLQGIDASEASKKEKLAQAESTLRVLLGNKSAAAVVEKLAGIMGQLSESAGQSPAP